MNNLLIVALFLVSPSALAMGRSVPENYSVIRDVTYCSQNGIQLQANVAIPDHPWRRFPAIVFIHGGAWVLGNRSSLDDEIERAAQRGFVGITISYRLTHQREDGEIIHPYPAQLEDVRCAIRYFRENARQYSIQSWNISAVGYSAGAHLAMMLATTRERRFFNPSRIRKAVNYFGPADLKQLYDYTPSIIKALMQLVFEGTPEENSELYLEGSPLTHLDRRDSPILTFHGDEDVLVPVQTAYDLDHAAQKVGVRHQLVIYPGQNHGFSPEIYKASEEVMYDFLTSE